jgi:hypothetical protein
MLKVHIICGSSEFAAATVVFIYGRRTFTTLSAVASREVTVSELCYPWRKIILSRFNFKKITRRR